MELKEIFKMKLKLEEKKKKGTIGKLYFPWIRAEKENANGRIYSEKIVKKEIEKFNKQIKDSGIAGQLSHPIGSNTRLDKVSHVITKLDYDQKNQLGYAEAQILDTTAGKDLLVVINQDLKGLGASLRGLGSVDDKTKMVNDNFELKSIDLVLNPSFGKDTAVSAANLIESGNEIFIKNGEEKEKQEAEEKFVQSMFELSKLYGWGTDDYEEFKATVGDVSEFFKEQNILEKENEKEKLIITKEQFDKKLDEMLGVEFDKEVISRRMAQTPAPTFEQFKKEYESNYAKILAKIYKERGYVLNEVQLLGEKETRSKKFMAEDIKQQMARGYAEARKAGYRGSQKEWFEKHKKTWGLKERLEQGELTEQQVKLYHEAVQSGYKKDFDTWKENVFKKLNFKEVEKPKPLSEEEKKQRRIQEEIRNIAISGGKKK